MSRFVVVLFLTALLAVGSADALVEPESGVAFPDSIVIGTPAGPTTLVATGAGLRERTILEADVYTVVSYVRASADLGSRTHRGDPGAGCAQAPADGHAPGRRPGETRGHPHEGHRRQRRRSRANRR